MVHRALAASGSLGVRPEAGAGNGGRHEMQQQSEPTAALLSRLPLVLRYAQIRAQTTLLKYSQQLHQQG